MANYKAVFIGTGMIGAGLGANALLHDFDVTLYDVVSEEQIRKNLKNIFDILVEAGMTTQAIADEKQKTVKISTDLKEALKGGADIVQEAVPEREDLKRSIFRTVQEILGDKTIIVSTTSHYFPSILQKDALYPGNILVAHPYNPSYILPLIEICGPECPKDVIDKVVEVYTAMGRLRLYVEKKWTVLLSITFPGKHFLQLWISLNRVFAPLKMWIAPSCSVQVCEWPFSVRSCASASVSTAASQKVLKNTACLISQFTILPEKAWKKKLPTVIRNSVIQLKV